MINSSVFQARGWARGRLHEYGLSLPRSGFVQQILAADLAKARPLKKGVMWHVAIEIFPTG
jgi:hypothetical protein